MEDSTVETNDSAPEPEPSGPPMTELPEDDRTRESERRNSGTAVSETPVDPSRVEPVGQTLGEPGKQHWDTKQPEPDASPTVSVPVRVPPPQRARPLA